MPNLNHVAIMGNLTRNPELRVTPKGTAICTFSIAVNRSWKDEGGAEKTEVFYADCECWGRGGETIAKYLTKGNPLYISGRLRTDSWEDKNTKEKRSRTKIVCDNFQFLGGKKSDSSEKPQGDQDRSPTNRPAPTEGSPDEDVPW